MKTEIKQININHQILGNIIIHTFVPKDIKELIGDVVGDYSRDPEFYYSEIIMNKDGAFFIKNLRVIRPENINVGWMDNSKGVKNFITVITDREAGDDILIYPPAIYSVIYEDLI